MKKYFPLIVFALVLSTVFVVRQVRQSVLFKNKDRINVVFYGKETTFFSLGKTDNIHYVMSLYPDLKIKVPGGYGYYRVGALGKLVYLEHAPVIIRNAFSLVSNSFTDYYFYPDSSEIYYGKEEARGFTFPSVTQLFTSQTNANMIDKLYFLFAFMKRKDQFEEIDYRSKSSNTDEYFQDSIFTKKYLGYFYDRGYRKEQRTVRIVYENSYDAASSLGKVLDGEGIRVVDIGESNVRKQSCVVREHMPFSRTAQDISQFLSCPLRDGEVEGSDIMITLGEKEKEWEVK